jgi:hypothetical protein
VEAAMIQDKHFSLLIAICLILIAASFRILPHPANFAPVAAIAIFGGVILPRKLALWVPLSAMIISDLVIGLHPLIFLTWGCYMLIALASSTWLRKSNLLKGLSITLGGSVFFFIVTNFGVWAESGMYAHTWNGLMECYYMALPFFRNTVMSDLIYTAALFGIYFATKNIGSKLQNVKAKVNYLTS